MEAQTVVNDQLAQDSDAEGLEWSAEMTAEASWEGVCHHALYSCSTDEAMYTTRSTWMLGCATSYVLRTAA